MPERSLTELTRDLAVQLSDLFRNELRLARVEAVDNVKSLAGGLALLAAGALLAGASLTLALMAVAAGLALVMPVWAAAGIAAGGGAVLAVVLLAAGRSRISPGAVSMPRTTEQVRRDINLIKEQTPS
jgi:hypothetical protein